jgi:SAM-dependent methyltransferase
MVFPWQDPHWAETARWITAEGRPERSILAPDMFQWVLPRLRRYADTRFRPGARYDLVLLHKGTLDLVTAGFARRAQRDMTVLHANPVFAVMTEDPAAAPLDEALPDVASLREALALRMARPDPPPPPDPVLPDPGEIVRFATLSRGALAQAMDRFWEHGGYRYETLRDRAYVVELDDRFRDMIGDCADQDVLDLCCGIGRVRPLLAASARMVGVDIARNAVAEARRGHGVPGAVMDAALLGFRDACFDTVLLVDSLEHVQEPEAALIEAGRVCRPGGRLLVSTANSDGLNQRLARALGTGGFVINYQHVREHSPAELTTMLDRAGFEVLRSEGLFLYPWWGVPGLDGIVRQVEDDDPEIVEAQRVLGRRAGPDYAFAFVMLARRR